MATQLLLIRHGESLLGSQGRYAGHADTPLTPKGRDQVFCLRRRFIRFRVARVYSSDLERCRETARILSPDGEIISTRQLRELDFGMWDGRTSDEILRRSPVRYRRWLADPQTVTPSRGESLFHLARRVRRFVREIIQQRDPGNIAIVTHGGPIRTLLLSDLKDFWSIEVPPASMTVRTWDVVRGMAS